MKKIFCLLCLLGLSFTLSGCGTKTLTCTKSETESGMTNEETMTVKFKDDKPSSATMKMDIKFDDSTKSSVDMMYSLLESGLKEAEQDGVKVDTKKTDNSITVKLDVDFSKVKDEDGLDLDFDSTKSFSEVKEEIEEEGYKCK